MSVNKGHVTCGPNCQRGGRGAKTGKLLPKRKVIFIFRFRVSQCLTGPKYWYETDSHHILMVLNGHLPKEFV